MLHINTYLQNKGFKPNKEMSTFSHTTYDIDSFGVETTSDNLVVENNTINRWSDKVNKTHGNIFALVMNMNDAYDYNSAITYVKSFTPLIKAWMSDKEERPPENTALLEYKEEVKERIYKLQSFAIMVQNFFDGKYFGYYHIKNFSMADFIDNKEFREVYAVAHQKEMDIIIDNPDEIQKVKNHYVYANNARMRGYPKLSKPKKPKRRIKSITEMLQEAEDEWQSKLYEIQKNGGNPQEYIDEEMSKIKKELNYD